jgi:hypothetical protein
MSGEFGRFDTEDGLVGREVRVRLEDGTFEHGWRVEFLIANSAVVVKDINPEVGLVHHESVTIEELLSWQ